MTEKALSLYEIYQICWNAFQFLIMIVIGVYVWWTSRNRVTGAAIDTIQEEGKKGRSVLHRRLDRHGQRLTEITGEIKNINGTCDSRGKELEKIGDLHGALEKLTGKVGGLSVSVNLIHEHLLNNHE